MPTPLILKYSAYAIIDVPNAIAEKLVPMGDNEDGAPWRYWIKWGTLHYWDDDMEEHEIESRDVDTEYKYDKEEDRVWEDPESSDDESS